MFEKALAYARLLRLSNGPTALADVWMGYAVVSGSLAPSWPLLLASLASLALYHGGMALNDANDAEKDTAENRGRPIAEGLITPSVATWVARSLLFSGLGLGIAASASAGSFSGQNVTLLLAIAIVLYNSRLKSTLAGPPLMGACRGLNIMLGMAVAGGTTIGTAGDGVPVGQFLYITGVTLYARDEAGTPKRSLLAAGAAMALVGIAWLATCSSLSDAVSAKPIATIGFWIAVALMATRGMAAAILQPTPRNLGRGVGIAIQGLVILDATLAALYAGPMAGLAILALLPVTMLLARWIPQT
ncbi:prenyltransferase [Planctomycetes bacterium MalM25]|nr:prenyltransferase [Planctomycetes bacterium MalM25]